MNFELLMNISTACQIALFVAVTIKTYRGKMKKRSWFSGKTQKNSLYGKNLFHLSQISLALTWDFTEMKWILSDICLQKVKFTYSFGTSLKWAIPLRWGNLPYKSKTWPKNVLINFLCTWNSLNIYCLWRCFLIRSNKVWRR